MSPPGDLAFETALMRGRGVTHLVTRNSGGSGRAKLVAARALGVQVILIARPALPVGVTVVAGVADALAWLAGRP